MMVGLEDTLLVTGSTGFIGSRLVEQLVRAGFKHIRCLVRSNDDRAERLRRRTCAGGASPLEILVGNLQSRSDAAAAARGVRLAFHLAAGMEKSFAGSFLNTVVTTRNLLEALSVEADFRRFVNVSSLAVYSNRTLRRHAVLDEGCPIEDDPVRRYEPYVYAKLKQDQLVLDHARQRNLPYVIVRPGAVFGPGKPDITSRVGIDTFGIFLHLGRSNQIPFTHVENCADAILRAGLVPGIDGQVFNIVDDNLPTGQAFMARYRSTVSQRRFLTVPYALFYAFSAVWERYSHWSEGQLPPVFNPYRCAAYWKGNVYSNHKIKQLTGWTPRVHIEEAMTEYFNYLRMRAVQPC
jgi:nucleoside-diphosphate-sugar epimerase